MKSHILTIQNIKKLKDMRSIDGDWYVDDVDEMPTQYCIYLYGRGGYRYNIISIERTRINNNYEMWWWDNNVEPIHQIPIRIMLSNSDLKFGPDWLVKIIDYELKKRTDANNKKL